MLEFPQFLYVPLAEWIDIGMSWILTNLGAAFDAVGTIILALLLVIEDIFLWIPWIVVVVAVGIISWRALRHWWAGVLFAAMLVLIGSFGYWDLAMMTLAIIFASVIISLAVGIPTGILMARSNILQSMLKPLLDAMQTMPSFVYLIPALMLFGMGKVPAVFATIIYAIPPVIRLTNVGIRQVPKSVIEAAQAFGSTPRQILY